MSRPPKRAIKTEQQGRQSIKKSKSSSFADAVSAGVPADLAESPAMIMLKQWMYLGRTVHDFL